MCVRILCELTCERENYTLLQCINYLNVLNFNVKARILAKIVAQIIIVYYESEKFRA